MKAFMNGNKFIRTVKKNVRQIFGNLGVNLDQISGQPRELQGSEITLSDQIAGAWTRFAATGNPNGPGLPTWPVFATASPAYLQQDISSATLNETQYRTQNHCDFWDPQITFPTI